MKKLFILLAVAAAVCLSSCTEEKFDTFVEWGFAENTESEITNGFETILPSAQVIFKAFDDAFYDEYSDINMGHEVLMRAQEGKSAAKKHAQSTAKKAHSMIPADHTCPVDYIFVVRIKYDSDKYETVWSHDYRAR